MTRLITVAHGTRLVSGNAVAGEITARAAELLGVQATTSYVELCAPLLTDVLADPAHGPAIVVPLLLSTGFHIKHDIPAALAGGFAEAVQTRALGPDPVLAQVQVERLLAAGAEPGQPLVMVAAGSNDPDAVPDLAKAEQLLARAWGGPVVTATVAGTGRPFAEAVAEARQHGDIAVSPYLLSPGFFSRRTADAAAGLGIGCVADVLGPHERIAELVALHYLSAVADARLAA